MARRRPQTFQSWALGLIGVLITCVVMYYARVAAIEYMAERQIERAQAAMAKIQEQAARQQQLRTTPSPTHQVDQYDAQVMKAAAESQRQHDAAWDKFYQAPRGCDNWKTDQQMVECQNHKLRAKRDFEQQWAAGKLKTDA